MTYLATLIRTGNWRSGGLNASAECLQRDECDWEVLSYLTLREATRLAENHVIETGHPVQVERAQFRVLSRGDR